MFSHISENLQPPFEILISVAAYCNTTARKTRLNFLNFFASCAQNTISSLREGYKKKNSCFAMSNSSISKFKKMKDITFCSYLYWRTRGKVSERFHIISKMAKKLI